MKWEILLALGLIGMIGCHPTDRKRFEEGFNQDKDMTKNQQSPQFQDSKIQHDQPADLPKKKQSEKLHNPGIQQDQQRVEPEKLNQKLQKGQHEELPQSQQDQRPQLQQEHQIRQQSQQGEKKGEQRREQDQSQLHPQQSQIGQPKVRTQRESEEQRKPMKAHEQNPKGGAKMGIALPHERRQKRQQHKGSMMEERAKRPMTQSMKARSNWEEDQHKKQIDVRKLDRPAIIKIKRSAGNLKESHEKVKEQLANPNQGPRAERLEGQLALSTPMKAVVMEPLNKDAMKEEARPRPAEHESRLRKDDSKLNVDSTKKAKGESAAPASPPLQIESIMIKANRQARQYGLGAANANAQASATGIGTGIGGSPYYGGMPYGGYYGK